MNRGRRLLLTLTIGVGIVAAGAVAFAYFAANGTGNANAAVASLAAPSGVTVPGAIVGNSVHITWTGVSAPDSSATVAYWVQRSTGATAVDACGSTQTSPIAAGTGAKSCNDSGVPAGTYTYKVTSVWRSWTKASAASGSVTVSVLDHFAVSAPSSATAGTAFSVTVAAKDASNNTLSAYVGSVHFTSSDAGSPVLPSDYTFVAGDAGSHTFASAVTLKTAGSQTVSLNDTVQTSKTGTSATITVGAASLDHFVVTAPSSATAGTAFATATVAARDIYNNPASGWLSATQCVVFSGPGSAPSGTGAAYPAQAACAAGQSSLAFNGAGQAGGFNITLYKAESTTLTVTASGKTGTSATITVAPAALDHFAVSAPATATVATAFTTATLAAQDLYNNAAAGWTSLTKCVTFSGPGNAPNGTAPNYPAQGACAAGQSSVSFNGSGQASGFSITLYKAEVHSLTVTDPASSKTGTSAAVTVSPGTAAAFVVSSPSPATAGTSFAVTSLTARDAYNNTATSYTGSHTIAWSGPGNAPIGTAPSYTTSVAFTAGVSTTTLTTTLFKAESATLSASESSGPSGSTAITVNPGTASNFLLTAPTSATAGTSFTVTSLTARDAWNNTATGYTGSHTIAWSGPSNAPSGTAPTFPATAVSFTAGVSTTSLSATLVKAESTSLTAAATTPTLSGSASITVNPGTATNFLVNAPGSATAGSAFTVTSLTARDAFNNVVTAYSGVHTLSWSGAGTSVGGNAPSFPATSVSFTNGVSTTSLTATLFKAETASLTAQETSGPSGSTSITVSGLGAARLAWTHVTIAAGTLSSPCGFTCTDTALGNNANFTANVSVTDIYGNTVSNLGAGHTVTVSTPTSGAGSGGAFTAPAAGTSVTLTIASSGAADSTVQFVFKAQNGSWTSESMTAATLAGTSYTSATATVTKQ
jgi:hypothetical protein